MPKILTPDEVEKIKKRAKNAAFPQLYLSEQIIALCHTIESLRARFKAAEDALERIAQREQRMPPGMEERVAEEALERIKE